MSTSKRSLRDFLVKHDFVVWKVIKGDMFICQIYVDDILFGSINKTFSEEFSKLMTKQFEMSMMGELKFFLGFQIKQLKKGTFISQTKYTTNMLKKFEMENTKEIRTQIPTNGHLDTDEDGKAVDQRYITP
jgi:hypothetical protein